MVPEAVAEEIHYVICDHETYNVASVSSPMSGATCSKPGHVSAGLRSLWLRAGKRSCVDSWSRTITESVAENEACHCKKAGRVYLGPWE